MKLQTIVDSWNDFFFKPVPVEGIALFRIAFGLLLFASWLLTLPVLNTFYGPEAMTSLETVVSTLPFTALNIFAVLPQAYAILYGIYAIYGIAILCLTLGYQTRLSSIIVFLILVSLHHRNVYILNSADGFFRNLAFFMMFAPAGMAFSIDRQRLEKRLGPLGDVVHAPWAQRLMQVQFAMLYFATVVWKSKGSMWLDGTAIYTATRLDEFVRFPMSFLNNLLIIKFMTWSTLAVELALGTLVWIKEFRYWVLLSGILLHLGIEFTMNIPLFELIMIAGMINMVDPFDAKNFVTKGHLYLRSLISIPPKFSLTKAKALKSE